LCSTGTDIELTKLLVEKVATDFTATTSFLRWRVRSGTYPFLVTKRSRS
jgi:hypothetical protein